MTGDSLTYSLAISGDGGETWLPIDIDITGNKYELDTEVLEKGQEYLIKVWATDGVNAGEDVSDGVFTITAGAVQGEEGGIGLWVIIVIVIAALSVAGVAIYFLRRPKRA